VDKNEESKITALGPIRGKRFSNLDILNFAKENPLSGGLLKLCEEVLRVEGLSTSNTDSP
jgi:hypothetical protein